MGFYTVWESIRDLVIQNMLILRCRYYNKLNELLYSVFEIVKYYRELIIEKKEGYCLVRYIVSQMMCVSSVL